jgi:hypothetical protein
MHTLLTCAAFIAWAGAAWAQTAPLVGLTLNQSTFRPGETLRLGLQFNNPGLMMVSARISWQCPH